MTIDQLDGMKATELTPAQAEEAKLLYLYLTVATEERPVEQKARIELDGRNLWTVYVEDPSIFHYSEYGEGLTITKAILNAMRRAG